MFVESWEQVLTHFASGLKSLGVAATDRGGKPYTTHGNTLFIHYLDIGSAKEDQLKPHVDRVSGRALKDRVSLPGEKWWICAKPAAFIEIEGKKARATTAQFRVVV